MFSNFKKTFCCLYYELKYFYNYYFKSRNVNSYTPLEEVVVDSQPRNSYETTYKNITTEFYPTYNKLLVNQEIRKRKSLDNQMQPISEEEFEFSSESSVTSYSSDGSDTKRNSISDSLNIENESLEWDSEWEEWQVV